MEEKITKDEELSEEELVAEQEALLERYRQLILVEDKFLQKPLIFKILDTVYLRNNFIPLIECIF